jgi:formylglycine-generating enzyme required for sulfatase activity
VGVRSSSGNHRHRYGSLNQIAWFRDNSGRATIDGNTPIAADKAAYPRYVFENGNMAHPVGMKAPNAWNLYDMLGNVYQWVADYYGDYKSADGGGPARPAGGGTSCGSRRLVVLRFSYHPRIVPLWGSSGGAQLQYRVQMRLGYSSNLVPTGETACPTSPVILWRHSPNLRPDLIACRDGIGA